MNLKKPLAILCDSAVADGGNGDDFAEAKKKASGGGEEFDGGMDVEDGEEKEDSPAPGMRKFTIVGIAHKKILFNSRP